MESGKELISPLLGDADGAAHTRTHTHTGKDAGGSGANSAAPTPQRGASRDLQEKKVFKVNTGGGRLYRLLLCGRRDKRKEPLPGLRTRKAGAFDGLDFDEFWSPVNEAHRRSQTARDHQRTAAIRWILNFVIGCAVALAAVFIIYCVRQLTSWKFNAVYNLIARERTGSLAPGVSYLAFTCFNLLYVLPATYLVAFVEPAAGSSGIPEIKMILNGVKMPRVTRFKALVCRVIGNIFSVASGLPVGYEGPAVTIGAALAAGLSQGKSTTLGFDTRWIVYSAFRNDKEKRDFIVCGAGAGVAAAFNAPVGGVLFSYEESASFWHRSLTWRALFCAMVAAYVIDVFLSGINNDAEWGKLSSPGMFNFGVFHGSIAESWSIFELPLFVLMGILGGLFGAMFNALNKRVTEFRLAYVNHNKYYRAFEAIGLTLIVSTIAFLVPRFYGRCINIPEESVTAPYVESLVPFYCPEGQFNDIASLWFAPTEEAIRQLYHFTDGDPFSLPHLAVLFCVYTTLMCLSAGSAIPAGLFIPTLLSGSALGRFTGQTANAVLPNGWTVDAGVYSLIGSAAMLAGTTRMTISLAVILLECTGNYQYGLPIMLTLMSARFAGNLFNPGFYDMQIELRKWPLLEEHVKKTVANELRVCDVMTPAPLVFQEVEKVGRVFDVLQKFDHNGFPVVFSEPMLRAHPRLGNLAGYIQRRHLATLLANRAFHVLPPWQPFLPGSSRTPDRGPTPDIDFDAPSRERSGPSPMDANADGGASRLRRTASGAWGRSAVTAELHTASDIRLRFPRMTESIRFPAALRVPVGPNAGSDETDSNRAAVEAARTGRASGVQHSFRTSLVAAAAASGRGSFSPPPITGVTGSLNAAPGAISAGSTPARPGSMRAVGRPTGPLSVLDESRITAAEEPATSSVLYNALYSQEYRYIEEPLLLYEAFEATYPRFPDVSSMTFSAEEREMYIDLRPYMDASPVTAHVNCPLPRAFKLFRTLGMRHLIVVNNCHDVVGIVTRHDLVIEHLKDCVNAVHRAEEEMERAVVWETAAHDNSRISLGVTRPTSRATSPTTALPPPPRTTASAQVPSVMLSTTTTRAFSSGNGLRVPTGDIATAPAPAAAGALSVSTRRMTRSLTPQPRTPDSSIEMTDKTETSPRAPAAAGAPPKASASAMSSPLAPRVTVLPPGVLSPPTGARGADGGTTTALHPSSTRAGAAAPLSPRGPGAHVPLPEVAYVDSEDDDFTPI